MMVHRAWHLHVLLIVVWLFSFVAKTPAEPERSQLDTPGSTTISSDPNAWRILYIGDSITRHGTNEAVRERLGWNHVAGMAASKEENDYAHLLASRIQSVMPGKKVEVYFHSFGGNGSVADRLEAISRVLDIKPQLVVIQLGEHEKPENGLDRLETTYRQLVRSFNNQHPRPLLLCVGPWNPPSGSSPWFHKVEQTMLQVCREEGVPFVSVDELAIDESCRGWGTDPGVKWHPNDRGHYGYADKLFAAYRVAVGSQKNTSND